MEVTAPPITPLTVAEAHRWVANCSAGWQEGEQGILAGIFRALEKRGGVVVEIGAGDGDKFPLTANPFILSGWTVILYESDSDRYAALTKRHGENERVKVRGQYNVGDPIDEADLLIIDVDGLDYYIWQAAHVRPAVVCIEHHDLIDHYVGMSVPVVPPMADCGKCRPNDNAGGFITQANCTALDEIAVERGYVLVARTRFNSIYARREVAEKLGAYPDCPPGAVYLNLGSGDKPIPGWVNLDIRDGHDVRKLPYPDRSVDRVRASHILEHFGFDEAPAILREWARVLKPGGVLQIAVPDVIEEARRLLDGRPACDSFLGLVYGGQTDPHDFHKNGWNREGLDIALRDAGLISVEPWTSTLNDCASLPVSLNLQGVKPTLVKRRVALLMSTPLLMHKHNIHQVFRLAKDRTMAVYDFGGAYWHQGMERLMREHCDDHEWLLTVDYDTQFNTDIYDRLCVTFEAHPEADALAPLQVKREASGVLANLEYDREDPTALDRDVLPARSAHFGMTLFRTDAIRRFADWCKARGEPMMLERASADCDWGDGRVDADMNFWRRWREAGLRLYVTPRLGVGHLEQVGVWVGEDFGPVYQPVSKFQNEGPPLKARR